MSNAEGGGGKDDATPFLEDCSGDGQLSYIESHSGEGGDVAARIRELSTQLNWPTRFAGINLESLPVLNALRCCDANRTAGTPPQVDEPTHAGSMQEPHNPYFTGLAHACPPLRPRSNASLRPLRKTAGKVARSGTLVHVTPSGGGRGRRCKEH